MFGRRARRAVLAMLVLASATAACGKKNIDASSELAGAVRWYTGVTVERIMAEIRDMFEAAGYPVASVDGETGRIETEWGAEFSGARHGWRLTQWNERQKFVAFVSRSQHLSEQGEPLVNVLLRIRWEERPPKGQWRIKEEGGAPSQSSVFRQFVRELDERAGKLGARRG